MLFPEDDSGSTIYLRSPMGGPVARPKPESPEATIAAGFRLQSAPYNVALMLKGNEDEPVEGYNALNDIKGTEFEPYAQRFTFSLSPSETNKIKSRTMEENNARRVLANSPGVLAAGAQMVAEILDPTIFLPAGSIYRGVKGAASFARTAASAGVAGAVQTGLQEAALQASQATREPSESVVNIGTATLLSAILGGAGGAFLSRAERQSLESQIGKVRSDLSSVGSSAGAAQVARNLDLVPFLPTWMTAPAKRTAETLGNLVDRVPVVGKPIRTVAGKVAGVPEWLSTKTGPMLRIMTGPSAEAKKAMVELAEVPLRVKDNLAGLTTSERIPLEREIKTVLRQAEFHLTNRAEELFREFRFGSNDVKFAKMKAALQSRFGKEGMTFDQFMEEVDWSLRHGDRHDIPQVAALAKDFREVINAPYEKAVQLGLLTDKPPLGAESYGPRRMVRDKLIANKPLFLENYVAWRRGDQAAKADLQAKIRTEWDALRRARIEGGKTEGRLATAEKRIGDLESRLGERGKETTAALDRFATVEKRNQEAKAATQELRDFIGEMKASGDNAPNVRDQIKTMEDQLHEIEKGSQLATDADLSAIDKAEKDGILTGNMRRVARVVTGRAKPPKPPSFWKWVADQGGVKQGLTNTDARSAPGLSRMDGMSLDTLQRKLAEEFPELRARGYGYDAGKPSQSFSDDIAEAIQESVAGREPDWFLNEKWNPDDRFVTEWSDLLDQAARDAGVEFKSVDDVANFFRGEADGMTEADYDAIAKSVEEGSAAPVKRAEGEALQEKIDIRRGTLALFKDAVEQARAKASKAVVRGKVASGRSAEAGIAKNRNLGRLGILNERARIAERRQSFLEAMRQHSADNEEAARARIEELLQKWEGKTSEAAKKSLDRRLGQETSRGAKIAGDRYKGKNERLTSADADVERAVRDVLKSEQNKLDVELAAEAEQTFNEYIGTPDGRLPKDDPTYGALRSPSAQGQGRGPLIARRNPMPDDLLLPFMDRNPLRYTMHYLRSMTSDIGMFERTGDFEGTAAMKAIDNEASLAARNATETQRLRIYQERDRMIADYAAIRDRLKGIYGFSADTVLRKAGEISQGLGDYDVTTNMGMSGAAQIPDFANIVARYAFSGGLSPAFQSLAGHLSQTSDTFKKARAEYGAIVGATEMFLNSRGHELADIGDVYQPATKFARILRTGAKATMVLSGSALMTDWEKTVASIAAATSFLKSAEAIAAGRATQKQITELAEAGIGDGMAKRIWQQFSGPDGGHISKEGAYLTNTANWSDIDARKRFEAAIGRDVDISVATPGEEKPLFLSTPTLALIGKYKSFVAAANTRILLANLQRRDASTLSGFITAVALGMLVSSIRSEISGIDMSKRRPQDWIKEGVDRSGMLGWLGEANAMAAQATRGSVDLYRLVGADRPLSRYSSRSILGSITGPIGGKIESMSQITGAAATGQWSAADVHRLRQLIPFQNLIYLRNLIDQVEAGASDTFGIPQKH